MLLVVAFLIVVAALCLFYTATKRPHKFPPGPSWLPIVGNLPVLKKLSKQLGGQHLALMELARQYNTNVLGLKLGGDYIITVFSYPLIKQVLRGEEYEGRPDSFFIRLRSMGTRNGITCTDGDFWTVQRNFVVRHLRNLGFAKRPMDVMISEELQDILNILKTEGDSGVNAGRLLAPSVINILWALTAGHRISRQDPRLNKLLSLFAVRSKAFDMSGGVLSQFPWTRFLFPEATGYNLLVGLNKQLRAFFMETIEEHHKLWTEGREDDLIYSFITEMKKKEDPTFTDDQLVMVCMDIFIGGAQTTSNTIGFALLMMILHPDIQAKVHQSLDAAFGAKTILEYQDRNLVPYVEAVLCEVERFCHVAPITGPRRVLWDTELDGYLIPKNCTVLISNHSIHHDVAAWGDPEIFRPERFLDANGAIKTHEQLIPFNIGKRRCLAEALARNCIFTFFAGILKSYSVHQKPDTPPLTGIPVPGLTLSPETYTALFTKRPQPQ